MDAITLIGLALALAMDAFAVALGTGAVLSRLTGRHLFRLGFHFGLFQALMPVIGWLAGQTIIQWVSAWDHWIAFGLLAIIGGRMIYEAFSDKEKTDERDPTKGLSLVLLSIATSIDALAVGFSLSVIGVSIWMPSLVIGLHRCARLLYLPLCVKGLWMLAGVRFHCRSRGGRLNRHLCAYGVQQDLQYCTMSHQDHVTGESVH